MCFKCACFLIRHTALLNKPNELLVAQSNDIAGKGKHIYKYNCTVETLHIHMYTVNAAHDVCSLKALKFNLEH